MPRMRHARRRQGPVPGVYVRRGDAEGSKRREENQREVRPQGGLRPLPLPAQFARVRVGFVLEKPESPLARGLDRRDVGRAVRRILLPRARRGRHPRSLRPDDRRIHFKSGDAGALGTTPKKREARGRGAAVSRLPRELLAFGHRENARPFQTGRRARQSEVRAAPPGALQHDEPRADRVPRDAERHAGPLHHGEEPARARRVLRAERV
mmetsp:Transcript_27151/g.83662  ORF Transcript_27151/g.83662 Transcript_27151/m.83662 type:complete len:209 (-) Transcript_27151:481-1107(-)